MTKEEREDAINYFKNKLENEVYHKKYNKLAIEALEQEPRWIPCSEKLPRESITVIGITNFDDIYKTELYDDCGEKKWYADGSFDVPIVAWMSKPKVYREVEE